MKKDVHVDRKWSEVRHMRRLIMYNKEETRDEKEIGDDEYRINFINGTIQAELKKAGTRRKRLTEAIENPIIIEQSIIESDPNLLYYGYNNNYNPPRRIMYNDRKYPNANNRNLNRDYNRDIRHFNRYQNSQPRSFLEKRPNYRQHEYRNQRPENYENNKTYTPLMGSRTAQITWSEAETEFTYMIQQETSLCKLSNTTCNKVLTYNVLSFEPVKFTSSAFLADPKPRITGYVRALNPKIPKILLKKQELTSEVYPDDAKNAVTMTSSAFSIQRDKEK
ncbi:hypothetical protein M0802_015070 [Mischocyttarus mexicanus]|nr:hypothetical protein M0802_015070 [Mischocyttarus mexicanus]